MKPSIVAKLEALHERHEEVQALLGDAQTIADQDRFRALSREYAQLSDVSRCFTDWQQVQEDIETAQMMLDDPEMREMAQDELREAKEKSEQLEQQLHALVSRFTVEPSVQQRFENASKESTEFTKRINVIGVTDQKGEKILLDTTGPIARTNTSYDGTKRRNPNNVVEPTITRRANTTSPTLLRWRIRKGVKLLLFIRNV